MTSKDRPNMPTTVHSTDLSAASSITTLAQGSMFWRPIFLAQSDWLEHIPFAFWLVEAHKPSSVVEIGTQDGASYFAFCQAIDRLHVDAHCYAVNNWPEESSNGENAMDLYHSVNEHNEAHYSSFSSLVRSTSKQALEHFTDHSIDLIHFDGLNGYESASQLIESWLPKLSVRGLILVHDTNVREKGVYAHQLFEELSESYPAFEFRHGRGLGILGVGEQQTDLINALFNETRERGNNQTVQDVFSRLGRACFDSYSARVSEQKETELEQKSETLKSHLESVEKSLSSTRTMLNEKNAEMNQLQNRIEQQFETHALERGQLVERSSMVQQLYDEVKSDAVSLRHKVEEATNKLNQHEINIFRFSGEKATLEKQLKSLQEKHENLQKGILEKDRKIAAVNQSLESMARDHEQKINNAQEEFRKKLAAATERDSEITSLTTLLKEKEYAYEQYLTKAQKEAAHTLEEVKTKADRELAAQITSMEAKSIELELQKELVSERFKEIAILTTLLETKEKEHRNELELVEKKSRNELELLTEEKNAQLVQLRAHYAKLQTEKGSKLFGHKETKAHIQLVKQSGLFDEQWYKTTYPDIRSNEASRKDPLQHFLLIGGFEGRNPSADFDTIWYLVQNPDVAKEGVNPLIHYILYGESEGRLVKPPARPN